jgi:hypothetical protein
MRLKFLNHTFFLFALLSFVIIEEAHAYLDMGTGSMVLQSIIAAIAGGLFVVRAYWQKFRNLFSRKKSTSSLKNEQSDKE